MPFRFAILGAGSIANKFAEAVKLVPGCEVAAVASRSENRGRAFAERHQIPNLYRAYAEMLYDERPDAAYIATTTGTHAALTRLCIEMGVPVLCEKAMFMSGAEAESTLALAREKGVFAMEAMWSRFLPAVHEMKRQLDAGVIGKPSLAEFAIGWKAPDGLGNRFFDPKNGGGAAYDLTVYGYELADFFLGKPAEEMQAAVQWGPSGVDESEAVLLSWPEKGPKACVGVLTASITANLDERAVLSGPGGELRMPKPHMAEGFTCKRADGTLTEWRDGETVNGFVYEVQEVVRCVRSGLLESPVVPHALTIRCAKMFDIINATKEQEK